MESMLFRFPIKRACAAIAVALIAVQPRLAFSAAAPATDTKGPYVTTTAEYRMTAAVDPDVLVGQATEIWARVYRPATLIDPKLPKQKRPLLVFLHGNHGTCGSGSAPRNDGSCEYTNSGTCPSGYVVTPNHEGYGYAAETLASWGYIVVSINANRGITCGSGDSDDWGLILARGRLVLRHLQLWNEWSTNGGAPSSLGDPNLFKDVVDLANVGLMGHSRGGEGVRAALNLYRDPASPWVAKIPGLDIRAIYEIGAVDGQSNRVLDAPSVAWNQTLPLCDGDVSNLEGRMPFERMFARFSVKKEAETRPTPKSLTMVWGANHNYFNTEWQTSDSYGCAGAPTHKPIFDESKSESREQQTIARQSMTAFFRAHVGTDKDAQLAAHFDPSFEFPTVFSTAGNVDRDFMPGFDLAKTFRVDDFTAATGVNPAGPKNTTSIVKVVHESGSEPPVANIEWTQSGEDRFYQLNFAEVAHGANISSFDFLDLRIGHVMTDIEKELNTPVDFSVQLVAGDDTLSGAKAISSYARVLGPPSEYAELTQTVRVPLADFAKANLGNIRGVRLVFNKTAKGKARIAHVRFGVKSEKMTGAGTETFAKLQEIQTGANYLIGHAQVALMDSEPALTTPADMILPEETKSVPYSLYALPRAKNTTAQRASWMKPRKISSSRELRGLGGFELKVSSAKDFPVMDALPVLNIENHLFPIARFPAAGTAGTAGNMQTLIFSISKDSFDRLPASGQAQIQYGIRNPTRVWTLPIFSKSSMLENMTD